MPKKIIIDVENVNISGEKKKKEKKAPKPKIENSPKVETLNEKNPTKIIKLKYSDFVKENYNNIEGDHKEKFKKLGELWREKKN